METSTISAEPVNYEGELQANEIMLFGKWSFEDIEVIDLSLVDYIAYKDRGCVYVPHSAGRYQIRRFRKAQCPIVERMVNSLMMHGRYVEKEKGLFLRPRAEQLIWYLMCTNQ